VKTSSGVMLGTVEALFFVRATMLLCDRGHHEWLQSSQKVIGYEL